MALITRTVPYTFVPDTSVHDGFLHVACDTLWASDILTYNLTKNVISLCSVPFFDRKIWYSSIMKCLVVLMVYTVTIFFICTSPTTQWKALRQYFMGAVCRHINNKELAFENSQSYTSVNNQVVTVTQSLFSLFKMFWRLQVTPQMAGI
jgi:hypothetical protein